VDVDYYRKLAKELVRGFRDGDPEVVERVERTLGDRARQRFRLSDAQFLIAAEHGQRSWAEFRRTIEPSPLDPLDRLASVERGRVVIDSGLRYTEGEPVRVFVRKRLHRYDLSDEGAAVRLAGRPPGWLDVAERVVTDEFWLNVNRRGVVFVPAVEGGMDRAWLARRVAEASRAVYQALLELE
jgi:hypothetical protein